MNLHIKLILIIFVISFSNPQQILANINIDTLINDKIITNYDISKEARYLKILNPNISNLNKKQINELARQSLIKEIIKKNEVSKLVNISIENPSIEKYYSNLFLRLGYKDEKSFKEELLNNETYSVDEIKLKIKIEFYWGELIFNRFKNQLNLKEDVLKKKIDKLENKAQRSIFLSEIVYKKQKNENIKDTSDKIQKAIYEIGFGNAANLYSISESAKFAGKVGWIDESTLSERIYKEIKSLKINQISKPIKLSDNFIILKIEDIKIIKNKIDKKKELNKIIEIEKNKKLEKFSRIYFNKIKKNYSINEK